MKRTFWRIVNSLGLRVTDRSTLKACTDILEAHEGGPCWTNGPYRIQKIEERAWCRPAPKRGGAT